MEGLSALDPTESSSIEKFVDNFSHKEMVSGNSLSSRYLGFLDKVGQVAFHLLETYFWQIDHVARLIGGEGNVAAVIRRQIEVVDCAVCRRSHGPRGWFLLAPLILS